MTSPTLKERAQATLKSEDIELPQAIPAYRGKG